MTSPEKPETPITSETLLKRFLNVFGLKGSADPPADLPSADSSAPSNNDSPQPVEQKAKPIVNSFASEIDKIRDILRERTSHDADLSGYVTKPGPQTEKKEPPKPKR